jgi:hypothetical protein
LRAQLRLVITTGRRNPELDTAVANLGPNATCVPGDVSNLTDLAAAAKGRRRPFS